MKVAQLSEPAEGHVVFRDGLGVRVRAVTEDGDIVHRFVLDPAFTPVQQAVQDRVKRLTNLQHVKFAKLRGFEKAAKDGQAVIISDEVQGLRLSDILLSASHGLVQVEAGHALQVTREVLAALTVLHDSRNVTHGSLGPERLVLTRHGRVLVVEHVLAQALDKLQLPRHQLWRDWRIATPPAAGPVRFDARTDLAQAGLLVLALLLGRALDEEEYPHRLRALLPNAHDRMARAAGTSAARDLQAWLERLLPIESRRPFTAVKDAQLAFEALVSAPAASLGMSPARVKALVGACAALHEVAPTEPVVVEEAAVPMVAVGAAVDTAATTPPPADPADDAVDIEALLRLAAELEEEASSHATAVALPVVPPVDDVPAVQPVVVEEPAPMAASAALTPSLELVEEEPQQQPSDLDIAAVVSDIDLGASLALITESRPIDTPTWDLPADNLRDLAYQRAELQQQFADLLSIVAPESEAAPASLVQDTVRWTFEPASDQVRGGDQGETPAWLADAATVAAPDVPVASVDAVDVAGVADAVATGKSIDAVDVVDPFGWLANVPADDSTDVAAPPADALPVDALNAFLPIVDVNADDALVAGFDAEEALAVADAGVESSAREDELASEPAAATVEAQAEAAVLVETIEVAAAIVETQTEGASVEETDAVVVGETCDAFVEATAGDVDEAIASETSAEAVVVPDVVEASASEQDTAPAMVAATVETQAEGASVEETEAVVVDETRDTLDESVTVVEVVEISDAVDSEAPVEPAVLVETIAAVEALDEALVEATTGDVDEAIASDTRTEAVVVPDVVEASASESALATEMVAATVDAPAEAAVVVEAIEAAAAIVEAQAEGASVEETEAVVVDETRDALDESVTVVEVVEISDAVDSEAPVEPAVLVETIVAVEALDQALVEATTGDVDEAIASDAHAEPVVAPDVVEASASESALATEMVAATVDAPAEAAVVVEAIEAAAAIVETQAEGASVEETEAVVVDETRDALDESVTVVEVVEISDAVDSEAPVEPAVLVETIVAVEALDEALVEATTGDVDEAIASDAHAEPVVAPDVVEASASESALATEMVAATVEAPAEGASVEETDAVVVGETRDALVEPVTVVEVVEISDAVDSETPAAPAVLVETIAAVEDPLVEATTGDVDEAIASDTSTEAVEATDAVGVGETSAALDELVAVPAVAVASAVDHDAAAALDVETRATPVAPVALDAPVAHDAPPAPVEAVRGKSKRRRSRRKATKPAAVPAPIVALPMPLSPAVPIAPVAPAAPMAAVAPAVVVAAPAGDAGRPGPSLVERDVPAWQPPADLRAVGAAAAAGRPTAPPIAAADAAAPSPVPSGPPAAAVVVPIARPAAAASYEPPVGAFETASIVPDEYRAAAVGLRSSLDGPLVGARPTAEVTTVGDPGYGEPQPTGHAAPPRTIVVLRSQINWRRTVAAGLILALLESAAFAAAWWWVQPGASGTLVVETSVPGVEVLLDGEAVGRTPFHEDVRPGRHTLTLRSGPLERNMPVEISLGVVTTQSLAWPAQSSGALQVTSAPDGAEVLIGGRVRGRTPLTLDGLAAGRHTLVVRSNSGTVSATATVVAGETTTIDVPIFAGWVLVHAPVDLAVSVDGTRVGSSLDGQILLAPGTHRIEVASETLGFSDTLTTTVEPGEVRTLTVTLPDVPLQVVGEDGAEVFVDGVSRGTLPGAVTIPLGTHEVVLRRPDGTDRRRTLTVRAGGPVTLD